MDEAAKKGSLPPWLQKGDPDKDGDTTKKGDKKGKSGGKSTKKGKK
jgi:hypothetical protein